MNRTNKEKLRDIAMELLELHFQSELELMEIKNDSVYLNRMELDKERLYIENEINKLSRKDG